MNRVISLRLSQFAVALSVLFFLALQNARAGSATWNAAPASGNWNTAGNWIPAVVPNGLADTATFAISNTTAVSLSANVEVNSIAHNSGASPFTISVPSPQVLTLSGLGLANSSGVTQNFAVGVNGILAGQISFTNSATSGSQTSFTTIGGNTFNYGGGRVYFLDNSSAAQSVFVNNGGTVSGSYGGVTAFIGNATAENAVITNLERANSAASGGGRTTFSSTTTAGNATIINKPNGHPIGTSFGEATLFVDKSKAGMSTITNEGATVSGQVGGGTNFSGSSSADQATIICEGGQVAGAAGGLLNFGESAKTGSGTLIAKAGVNGGEGGRIVMSTRTGAGSPIVQLHGNGTLITAAVAGSNAMIGALEGDGVVNIGSELSIGGSDLNFTFQGTIMGFGSLTKTGSGTFSFAGITAFSGGFTSVEGGTLIVTTAIGAGGYGVQVGDYSGLGATSTIGGSGTISASLLIGNGDPNAAAHLAPAAGSNRPATLTAEKQLSFSTGGIYDYSFKAKGHKVRADLVLANGVVIGGTPTINLIGQVQGALAQGLTLTLIRNTSADPISGVFANLPDGGVVTIGGNNFQANYEGGDGNDLTLTVVP